MHVDVIDRCVSMWLTGVCQCDRQVCVDMIDRCVSMWLTGVCQCDWQVQVFAIYVVMCNLHYFGWDGERLYVGIVLVIFRSWGTHTWFYEHIALVRGTRTSFPFSVIKGKTKTFVSLLFALIFERSRTADDGKRLLHDRTSCYTCTTSH